MTGGQECVYLLFIDIILDGKAVEKLMVSWYTHNIIEAVCEKLKEKLVFPVNIRCIGRWHEWRQIYVRGEFFVHLTYTTSVTTLPSTSFKILQLVIFVWKRWHHKNIIPLPMKFRTLLCEEFSCHFAVTCLYIIEGIDRYSSRHLHTYNTLQVCICSLLFIFHSICTGNMDKGHWHSIP